MPTLNERYQDILIRRAVELERFKGGLSERAISLLNQTEADLEKQIRENYPLLVGRDATPGSLRRLETLLKQVRDQRAATWLAYRQAVRGELTEFAKDEERFTREAFTRVAGIEDVALSEASALQLRAAVATSPFQGRPLNAWFHKLQLDERNRLEAAIRMGFLEGESIDQMVRRIRGTRAARFKDGLLQVTRRQAEAIVRTGVNHAATQARVTLFDENSDVIQAYVWSSVLDGRTTPICQARDRHGRATAGNKLPSGIEQLQPPDAVPPAHVGCRSQLTAVISPEGLIGNRPFVVSTLTRKRREIRFRSLAKEKAGARWSGLTERQRRRATARVRQEWANENIGTVPARMNYQTWLGRQTAEFQDEVLGSTRGKLFRKGKLSLDKFVDRSGHRYTLEELRRRERQAFKDAGLLEQAAAQ